MTEKKASKFSRTYDVAKGLLTGVFADGSTMTFDVNQLSDEMKMTCMYFRE